MTENLPEHPSPHNSDDQDHEPEWVKISYLPNDRYQVVQTKDGWEVLFNRSAGSPA